jgi:uncharacterized protein (TIGR00255 family)
VRSVNHRFCRVAVRVPSELAALEDRARQAVQARVQRGKVDVNVAFAAAAGQSMRVDRDAAAGWIRELRGIADEYGFGATPSLVEIVQLPGVVTGDGTVRADESTADVLAEALAEALGAFDEMRIREGADLAADLASRTTEMRARVEAVATVAESLPQRIRDQLHQRISDLLGDSGAEVSDERIVQEAAYHAERADVTEEIVRLRSHLDKVDELLTSDEAVGRTLEFVTQEIHRELNTIGSKTKDLEVSDDIVVLKAELERVREQVQNIE